MYVCMYVCLVCVLCALCFVLCASCFVCVLCALCFVCVCLCLLASKCRRRLGTELTGSLSDPPLARRFFVLDLHLIVVSVGIISVDTLAFGKLDKSLHVSGGWQRCGKQVNTGRGDHEGHYVSHDKACCSMAFSVVCVAGRGCGCPQSAGPGPAGCV